MFGSRGLLQGKACRGGADAPRVLGAAANPQGNRVRSALDGEIARRVRDPGRLAAVEASGLLDTAAEEPFDRLARLAAVTLDAPLAFVTVVDERRSFWKSCIGVDVGEPVDRQNAVEESFCQYVIGLDAELIVGDAASDPRTAGNPAIEGMGVRAWAGFPLRAPGGEALGSFCVVDTRVRRWRDRDVQVLRTLAEAAAGEVALRARAEEAATLARTLQQALLPPVTPEVPGMDVGAVYRAAGEGTDVMGDFYDLFESADGRWNAALGDVCGKGIAAARLTSLARYTLRAGAIREQAPSQVLRLLNEALLLAAGGPSRFVTAVLATFDPADDGLHLTLSSAGHVPAVLRTANGVRLLEAPGTLLGIQAEIRLSEVELRLDPDDTLILCTDGVTEARNRVGEQFGLQRLLDVTAAADCDGQAIADALNAAVVRHAGPVAQDDVAILVLRALPLGR